MAKTIKFNLICDQKPVRTIEDLQNNFSIEDVLAYYKNGLLKRWLEVRSYTEELDKVNAITSTDDLEIIKELIAIFNVTADEKVVEEGIHILRYLEKERELNHCYAQENHQVKHIIDDYATGYQQLVDGILQNPNDIALIKANIKKIVEDYSWVFELNHRDLFYRLDNGNNILALMCLLMNDTCRKFYLPINAVGPNGGETHDAPEASDKGKMYDRLRMIILSKENLDALGDHLKRFSGATDAYWKDLESKEKKYMIISMDNGNHVRSAGKIDEDFTFQDISAKFIIVTGVDYKSNNANHTLLYMEV